MKENDSIKTLKNIQEEFDEIKNINTLHRAKLSKLDKLAIFVTEKVGTMGFFFIIFTWTVLWLGWNILGPREFHFDPFPGFVFWLFISNLIQLHLMPLIMIGQNLQGKHAELRAEHEFRTNLRAKREIETVILRLEKQEKLITEILEKIDRLEKNK